MCVAGCMLYRGLLYSAQNMVKMDPGRARQNSLATAGTNFTKPGAYNKVDICIFDQHCTSFTSLENAPRGMRKNAQESPPRQRNGWRAGGSEIPLNGRWKDGNALFLPPFHESEAQQIVHPGGECHL